MIPTYKILAKLYDLDHDKASIQRVLDTANSDVMYGAKLISFTPIPDNPHNFQYSVIIEVDGEEVIHSVIVKPDFLHKFRIRFLAENNYFWEVQRFVWLFLETKQSFATFLRPEYIAKLPDYGDLIEVGEFIDCCKGGGFIDYDGGGWPVKDGWMSNDIRIKPSQREFVPEDCTHIMWFNR